MLWLLRRSQPTPTWEVFFWRTSDSELLTQIHQNTAWWSRLIVANPPLIHRGRDGEEGMAAHEHIRMTVDALLNGFSQQDGMSRRLRYAVRHFSDEPSAQLYERMGIPTEEVIHTDNNASTLEFLYRYIAHQGQEIGGEHFHGKKWIIPATSIGIACLDPMSFHDSLDHTAKWTQDKSIIQSLVPQAGRITVVKHGVLTDNGIAKKVALIANTQGFMIVKGEIPSLPKKKRFGH